MYIYVCAPEHTCTGTHTHAKFEMEMSISLEGYVPINPL